MSHVSKPRLHPNKEANKLTNKLPRPMWIAVGSSKGNIVLGIDNNFGSRFVSGILNVSSAPGPRPRDAYLGQPPPSQGKPDSGKGGPGPGPGPASSRRVARPSQRAPIAAGPQMCQSCIGSIQENVMVLSGLRDTPRGGPK